MGQFRRPQLQRNVRKENESAVVSLWAGASVQPGAEECLLVVEGQSGLTVRDWRQPAVSENQLHILALGTCSHLTEALQEGRVGLCLPVSMLRMVVDPSVCPLSPPVLKLCFKTFPPGP